MLFKELGLQIVQAQVITDPVDPLGDRFGTLADIFGFAINVIIGLSVGLALVFLGLGGIKYITSAGDAKAAQEARALIANAIIGMVIALGAVAIMSILFNILGVQEFDLGDVPIMPPINLGG